MTDLTLPIQIDPDSAPDKTLHVTASGLPVRIYSINGGGKYPIHGAVFEDGVWDLRSWQADGAYGHVDLDSAYNLRDRPKAKRGVWVAWFEHEDSTARYAVARDSKEEASAPKYGFFLKGVTYLEEGDGLDTHVDAPLVVDWAKLPEWAKWAAANESGLVCQYAHEPRADRAFWQSGYEWRPLQPDEYRLAPNFDWRKTLIQRPEDV